MHFEDLPRDAAVTTANMQHGDVLVLATDGVFDNLNNQDILKIISGRMNMAGAWTDSSNGAIGISACLGSLTRMDSLNDKPTPSILDSEDASTSAPSSLPQSQVSSYPSSKNDPTYVSTARSDRLVTPPATATSTRIVYRAPNLQTLLAATIVAEAKLASLDMRRDGPFAKEAQRHFPSEWYRGGKVDDITVLVIMAVEGNS
jgi:protein phosphatase PTC7